MAHKPCSQTYDRHSPYEAKLAYEAPAKSARTERSAAPAATLSCPRTHTDAGTGAGPGRSRNTGCAFAWTGPDRTQSDLIQL